MQCWFYPWLCMGCASPALVDKLQAVLVMPVLGCPNANKALGCTSADLLLGLLCLKLLGAAIHEAADCNVAHSPGAGMDVVQEEALARYEQFMRPEGMEAILNDDGTLPLGALAALPGGGLHQRSLNLRRSRGQAPRIRIVDYGPSRPMTAIPASEAFGDALSEGQRPGTTRPRPM